jgi:hypothetical protein
MPELEVENNLKQPSLPARQPLLSHERDILKSFGKWYYTPRQATHFESLEERECLVNISVGVDSRRLAAECVREVVENDNGSVLWVAHRDYLKKHSADAIRDQTGLAVAPSIHKHKDEKVIVTGNKINEQTLKKFQAQVKPKLIVIDEAQRSFSETYRILKQAFPDAKILNLSPTPFRTDVSEALDLGNTLEPILNPTKAIKLGLLTPFRPVAKLTHDFVQAGLEQGDYKTKGVSDIMRTPEMLEASSKAIAEHAHGRRGIVFCCDWQHATDLARCLQKKGLRVRTITEDVRMGERQEIYREMKEGKIDQILNVHCLTEGSEVPEVDMISILRPTKSAANYVHMLGRGLRLSPETGKKDCLLIDALDVAKVKGKGQETQYPFEDELVRFRAELGQPVSAAVLYLSWFQDKSKKMPALDSPATIYQVINGCAPDKLAMKRLQKVWKAGSLPAWDSGGYSELAMAVGCNGLGHLHKVLLDRGYTYWPHGIEETGPKYPLRGSGSKPPKDVESKGKAKATKDTLRNIVVDLVENSMSAKPMPFYGLEEHLIVTDAKMQRQEENKPSEPEAGQQYYWFKDPDTEMGYMCFKDTPTNRRLLILSPRGRAVHFTSDRLNAESLRKNPSDLSRAVADPEPKTIRTAEGKQISLGRIRPALPTDFASAFEWHSKKSSLDSRISDMQLPTLAKQLTSNRTRMPYTLEKLSKGAASFLIGQSSKDIKALLKHLSDRMILADAYLDIKELNEKSKELKDKPDKTLSALEVARAVWGDSNLEPPRGTVQVTGEIYYLAYSQENGFDYRSKSGKSFTDWA